MGEIQRRCATPVGSPFWTGEAIKRTRPAATYDGLLPTREPTHQPRGLPTPTPQQQQLEIIKPLACDMPLSGHTLLSANEVNRLFAAMPGLKSLRIDRKDHTEDEDKDGDKEEKEALETSHDYPIALVRGLSRESSACPQLVCLELFELGFPGDALIKTLRMRKGSLRHIRMEVIGLDGGDKRSNHWTKVFGALLEMNLQSLELKSLLDSEVDNPQTSDYLLKLIKLSRGEKRLLQLQNDDGTLELVRPNNENRHGDEAFWSWDFIFPCWAGARFRRELVKPGLERMLGKKNHAVVLYRRT